MTHEGSTIKDGRKLDNASVWCLQIEPGRYCVTGRNLTFEVKEALLMLKGALQIERSKTGFKMVIPHSSVSALREQCQASGIPVQMIETDTTAPVATSQRQRQIDDGRPHGRFIRFGCHWTFRFDK